VEAANPRRRGARRVGRATGGQASWAGHASQAGAARLSGARALVLSICA
jgi:hypothetical protein